MALPLKISASKRLKSFLGGGGMDYFIGQIMTKNIYKKLHCKRE